MREDLHIIFLWGWNDWIMSTKNYGAWVGRFWIGFSTKIPQKEIDRRKRMSQEWIESLKN